MKIQGPDRSQKSSSSKKSGKAGSSGDGFGVFLKESDVAGTSSTSLFISFKWILKIDKASKGFPLLSTYFFIQQQFFLSLRFYPRNSFLSAFFIHCFYPNLKLILVFYPCFYPIFSFILVFLSVFLSTKRFYPISFYLSRRCLS